MADDLNPKARGLGRGLDALFGEDETAKTQDTLAESAETKGANDIISDDLKRRSLPIEWLRPCAFQPRKYFDESTIDELAASISIHGVLQPIVVRPLADEENVYEIIAGERRWRASQKIQLHEVPVTVQYLDDAAVLEIALIENLQREDLTAIEEAAAYQQLMSHHGHTQEELGIKLGKSRSYIANTLRLLTLPDAVQAFVNKGDLSVGHARALIGLDNAEELAHQIVHGNLSVRDAEKLAKSSKPSKNVSRETSTESDKGVNTLALEDEVSNALGMIVKINARQSGSGSVKIDYKDLDQLDEVLHRLSKGVGR
ncbi:MAG: chromosome partitioning protein ParB [Alphaproteobacteria bacterium]|nr:MAG: chromosome partitioning protein ParB [Alphaproteobacteria bacterium]